jgi:membrane-bound lytic murein transglycosylase MltF
MRRSTKLIALAVMSMGLLMGNLARPAVAQSNPDIVNKSLHKMTAPWKGDLDGMIKRGIIRALVVYSKTNYFLDGPQERGITYENLKNFEKLLNKKIKSRHIKVHVVLIPVRRDQLLSDLEKGRGDIAAAMLTETPHRLKKVDFADPFYDKAKEVVVTSPSAPAIKSLDDLSGKTVFVRKSSSYYQSLQKLNQRFAKQGKAPVVIDPADENLETEDILEMVNADLVRITVADDYLVGLWNKIFTDLKVHPQAALRSGGRIAWALRRGCPQLKQLINEHVKANKRGTLMGNILIKRYLKDTKWARNALAPKDVERFKRMADLFKQYSDKYRFDWLMIAALAYQESRLNQDLRSPAGAVGVMQILPSTAAAAPVEIPDIQKLEKNVHAGVKYLRHIYQERFEGSDVSELNRVLLTFASYNAGPNKVESMRRKAREMGLDPNVWFRNVEVVAAKVIGRETVQYVSNIFKYYIAYKQISQRYQVRDSLKKEIKP